MKLLIFALLFSFTAHADYTYTKDIKPLFKKRCEMCHNASNPSLNWMDYDTAFKKRKEIKDRVFVKKDMPMGNATNITEPERKEIADWVDQGAKK